MAVEFSGDVNQWNVKKMENATNMFYGAEKFNACISTWAYKSKNTFIDDEYMFNNSGCPLGDSPISEKGPWCQGEADGCTAVKKKFCDQDGNLAGSPRCTCTDT